MKPFLILFSLLVIMFSGCKKQELVKTGALSSSSKIKKTSAIEHGFPLVFIKNKTLMRIYLRTGADSSRWLQLNLRHDSVAPNPADLTKPSNYDIWHFRQLTEAYRTSPTSFTFTADPYQLCSSGEWEFGMFPTGAPDHVGGSTHGSEVKYGAFSLKVDGLNVNEYRSYQKECNEVAITQYTKLYEWNKFNSNNILALLKKVYKIKRDSIVINYEITFVKETHVTDLKFGMLPASRTDTVAGIAKQITAYGNRVVNGVLSPIVDISTTSFSPSGILTNANTGTSKISIWGDDFAASVHTERDTIFPNSKFLLSNSANFNKIYPDLTGETLIPDNAKYTMTARYYLGLKN